MIKKIIFPIFIFLFLISFISLSSAVATIGNVSNVAMPLNGYSGFNVNQFASGHDNRSTTLSFINPDNNRPVTLYGDVGGQHQNSKFTVSLSSSGFIQFLSYDSFLSAHEFLLSVGNNYQTQASDGFTLTIGSTFQGLPRQIASMNYYNITQGAGINFNNFFTDYDTVTLNFFESNGTYVSKVYYKYSPRIQNSYFGLFFEIEDNSAYYSPTLGSTVYLNIYEGSTVFPAGATNNVEIVVSNAYGSVTTNLLTYFDRFSASAINQTYIRPRIINASQSFPIALHGVTAQPFSVHHIDNSSILNLFSYICCTDPTLFQSNLSYVDMSVRVMLKNSTVSSIKTYYFPQPLVNPYFIIDANYTMKVSQNTYNTLLLEIYSTNSSYNYLLNPRIINTYGSPIGTLDSGSLFMFYNTSLVSFSSSSSSSSNNNLYNVFDSFFSFFSMNLRDPTTMTQSEKWDYVITFLLVPWVILIIIFTLSQFRLPIRPFVLGVIVINVIEFLYLSAKGYIPFTIILTIGIFLAGGAYLRYR